MIREKLYRDPVHDLIALDKNSPQDRLLMALIDAPEQQRLRRIRQLGLAWLAYQGAEHSRFTHVLGTMWMASRILQQLGSGTQIDPRMAFATRCAALLHDIGHAPFSHLFEYAIGLRHEDTSKRIILSPHTTVHKLLAQYDPDLPELVATILAGHSDPPFFSEIVASQIDADRFDYLLRDSVLTGVKYGVFDLERLLRVLRLDRRERHIVIAANGVQAVEKYLQSRYHMYSQVYFHKTVRAAEAMLGKLLARARDLAANNQLDDDPVTDGLKKLLENHKAPPIEQFLAVDDYTIMSSLARWRRSDDKILRDLATRLLDRRLFKTLNVADLRSEGPRVHAARELIGSVGLDPQYYFIVDRSNNVPYQPYDPARKGVTNHIRVEAGARHRYCDIHDISHVVRGLTRAAHTVHRVVFPETAGRTNLRKKMTELFSVTHATD